MPKRLTLTEEAIRTASSEIAQNLMRDREYMREMILNNPSRAEAMITRVIVSKSEEYSN